jgi:DNA-binding LacI/PurR family transcriptional regulator
MEPVPSTTPTRSPTTIRDVAERAGVGVGTVSRVLNGGASVRQSTLERVHDAIRELGFRPSPAARALSRRRASTIGVTAPHLTRPSVVERLRGVVETLGTSSYDLGLATVETGIQRERRLADLCQRDRLDGGILISLAPTPLEAERLRATGVPTVLVDTVVDGFPCIAIDDTTGGRMATEHLLELGHRRIAFIGDTPEEGFHFTSSGDRLHGYRDALADAKLDPVSELVVLTEHGRDTAARAARALLALPEPPTAIFASSDTQAVGVLEAARLAGVTVPDELSVVGFDDLEIASFAGLTTIRQPLVESGRRGAELLLELLDNPTTDANERIMLDLTLVPRQTTGRPRSRAPRPRPAAR